MLALTFGLIQYSVNNNSYQQNDKLEQVAKISVDVDVENNNDITMDQDILDSYEATLAQWANIPVIEGEGGDDMLVDLPEFSPVFSQRLVLFPAPLDAPELEFKNILGRDARLDDFKGQWVVVNFWASWCPPCIVEMPSLQQLQDEYAEKNLNVIAISLDRNNNAETLRGMLTKFSFGPVAGYFTHWPDIRDTYEIKGLPTTYIINPNGEIVARFRGDAEWSGDDAKSLLDYLMRHHNNK